jgi:hypothetical protein
MVFLELLVVVAVVYLMVTQLVIPTIKEQPTWPLFRKASAKEVEETIRKTKEQLEKEDLAAKADELQQKVKYKQSTRKGVS